MTGLVLATAVVMLVNLMIAATTSATTFGVTSAMIASVGYGCLWGGVCRGAVFLGVAILFLTLALTNVLISVVESRTVSSGVASVSVGPPAGSAAPSSSVGGPHAGPEATQIPSIEEFPGIISQEQATLNLLRVGSRRVYRCENWRELGGHSFHVYGYEPMIGGRENGWVFNMTPRQHGGEKGMLLYTIIMIKKVGDAPLRFLSENKPDIGFCNWFVTKHLKSQWREEQLSTTLKRSVPLRITFFTF